MDAPLKCPCQIWQVDYAKNAARANRSETICFATALPYTEREKLDSPVGGARRSHP
jgi:hypothetical protein